MAPMRRAPAAVVGVDVTAHKEARHVADAARSRRASNARVRYYIELVVGSPRGSHSRLGFSGTFKTLLRLHVQFEALFQAKHKAAAAAAARESLSSATSSASSASSGASPARRVSASTAFTSGAVVAAADEPKMVPFPTAHALLVKLQPRQHVESDEKARARCDALFAYYTALFNSDERELYLDYVQAHAEKYGGGGGGGSAAATPPTTVFSDNQVEDAAASSSPPASTGEKRGFLKKLFGRKRHDDNEMSTPTTAAFSSERQRAAMLDAKLEFAAPVHVTVKNPRRRGG